MAKCSKSAAPLLFRETGLLAVAAGIAGSSLLPPALLAWALMAWVDGRARGARLLVLGICFLAGLGLGRLCLPDPQLHPLPWPDNTTVRVRAEIVRLRELPDNRLRVVLDRLRPAAGGETLPALVAWTWEKPSIRPLPGQTLEADLRLRPVRGFLNHDGADMAGYWQRQGIAWTAWSAGDSARAVFSGTPSFLALKRESWRNKLNRALYGPDFNEAELPALPPEAMRGAPLVPALIFADQSGVSSVVRDQFVRGGIAHSLALSGQHLAVVGILAMLPLFLVRRACPRVFLFAPRTLLFGLISLPLAGLCLWLGNAPGSLVRASIMLAAWAMIQWRPRPFTLIDALCAALACMLLVQPGCLFDLGVQLSFLCVAGMAGATPFLSRCALRAGSLIRGLAWPPVPRAVAGRILTWLIWGIGLSAAAQIASLPIVLDTFGRMNPGFALNLIWLPVQAMVVLPAAWIGMLLQAAGCEAVAAAPLHLAAGVCSGLLHLLDILDAHGMLEPVSAIRPHWTAGIGYGALVVSLALSAGASGAARRLAGAGAALVLVAIGLRLYDEAAARTRLRLLDVGQGQAVLLEWRGGRGLVDAGGFAVGTLDSGKDIVAPVLTAGRAPRLNFAAASHMDHDHAGGLPFLLEAFDIPLFFSSAQTDSGIRPEERARSASPPARPHRSGVDDVLARKRIRKESPASGDRIILAPDLWLEALWPPPGRVLRANDSLVLRLVRETGGVRRGLAVLCGDLPRREQRGLLKLHAGRDITAQILVLPHHGSQRDLEPELYDVLKPSLALAATGAGNRWGFPSVRVREVLAQKGIPLLTTADYGELAIEFRADGLADVRPARPVQTPAP